MSRAYEQALATVHRFDQMLRRSVAAIERIEDAVNRSDDAARARAAIIPLARVQLHAIAGQPTGGEFVLRNGGDTTAEIRIACPPQSPKLVVTPDQLTLGSRQRTTVRLSVEAASPQTVGGGLVVGRVEIHGLRRWPLHILVELRIIATE